MPEIHTLSSKTQKKILVVEDDTAMSELIQLVLTEEGPYETVVVTNPYDAVTIATTLQPDLFVIDYLLSGMTGIELYDQLHTMPAFTHTPTIITSATLPYHQQDLLARQLPGLEKPFDIDTLLAIVRQTLT